MNAAHEVTEAIDRALGVAAAVALGVCSNESQANRKSGTHCVARGVLAWGVSVARLFYETLRNLLAAVVVGRFLFFQHCSYEGELIKLIETSFIASISPTDIDRSRRRTGLARKRRPPSCRRECAADDPGNSSDRNDARLSLIAARLAGASQLRYECPGYGHLRERFLKATATS